MVEGKTTSGFEFSVDEKALDNMELIDALAEADDDNPIAISKACLLLLGESTRKRLYDYLRTNDGRVPIEGVSKCMMDIFAAFGNKGKN